MSDDSALSKEPPPLTQDSPSEESRECPYCAETIKKRAKICRFCNRSIAESEVISAGQQVKNSDREAEIKAPPTQRKNDRKPSEYSTFLKFATYTYQVLTNDNKNATRNLVLFTSAVVLVFIFLWLLRLFFFVFGVFLIAASLTYMKRTKDQTRVEPWLILSVGGLLLLTPFTTSSETQIISDSSNKKPNNISAVPSLTSDKMVVQPTESAKKSPAPPVVLTEVQRQERLRNRAEEGDPQAQYELGQEFEKADSKLPTKDVVSAEMKQAVRWYEKAAEKGLVAAQLQLGELYERGSLGVLKNDKHLDIAIKWLRKAGLQNCGEAEYRLGMLYLGDLCSRLKNHKEAARWLGKACDDKVSEACYELAKMEEPTAGPKNDSEAAGTLLKGAQLGNVDCQTALGQTYEYGWGVNPDPAAAEFWYQKAAAQGNSVASENLAKLKQGDEARQQAEEQRKELADKYGHAPGDDCKLKKSSLALKEKNVFDEVVKVAQAHDTYGEMELIAQGKTAMLPEGTQLHVVSTTVIGWSESYLEVRIMDGQRFGEVWYVRSDACQGKAN